MCQLWYIQECHVFIDDEVVEIYLIMYHVDSFCKTIHNCLDSWIYIHLNVNKIFP